MDVYPTGWESSQLAIKKKGLTTIKKKAELKDELQKNSMERLKEKEKDELQKANEKKKTSITPGLVSLIQRKTIEVAKEEKQRAKTTKMSASSRTSRVPSSSIVLVK